jgi:hypothetical protein
MKLARCPSCRTVNDVTETPRCGGCDRDLSGVLPLRSRVAPLIAQAQRDQKAGRGFLLGLGILSAASLVGMVVAFHVNGDNGCVMSIVGFSSVTIFLWFGMARTIYFARAHALVKLLGFMVTAVLALFGAAILTGLTCAVGYPNVRLGG